MAINSSNGIQEKYAFAKPLLDKEFHGKIDSLLENLSESRKNLIEVWDFQHLTSREPNNQKEIEQRMNLLECLQNHAQANANVNDALLEAIEKQLSNLLGMNQMR